MPKTHMLIVGPAPLVPGASRWRFRDDHRSGGPPMFAIGIGFLVLFSALSVLLGNEDPRHETDPRDTLALWMRYGAR